jgi:hypothetical protein
MGSSPALIPPEATSIASGLGVCQWSCWVTTGGVCALSLHGLDSDGESAVCKESRGGDIMMFVAKRSTAPLKTWPSMISSRGHYRG